MFASVGAGPIVRKPAADGGATLPRPPTPEHGGAPAYLAVGRRHREKSPLEWPQVPEVKTGRWVPDDRTYPDRYIEVSTYGGLVPANLSMATHDP